MSSSLSQLSDLLSRYADVEAKLSTLNEEREQIRTQIKTFISAADQDAWRVELPQQAYKVNLVRRVNITYHEDVLRQRLGDKYSLILEPDLKKMRQNYTQIEAGMQPYLDLVGSPTRDRVRQVIESGQLTVQDFQGTFEKSTMETLYITRQKL